VFFSGAEVGDPIDFTDTVEAHISCRDVNHGWGDPFPPSDEYAYQRITEQVRDAMKELQLELDHIILEEEGVTSPSLDNLVFYEAALRSVPESLAASELRPSELTPSPQRSAPTPLPLPFSNDSDDCSKASSSRSTTSIFLTSSSSLTDDSNRSGGSSRSNTNPLSLSRSAAVGNLHQTSINHEANDLNNNCARTSYDNNPKIQKSRTIATSSSQIRRDRLPRPHSLDSGPDEA